VGATPTATRKVDTTGFEDSFNDLLKEFDTGFRRNKKGSAATQGLGSSLGSSKFDVKNMFGPTFNTKAAEPDPVLPLRTKLGPSLGRTVQVNEAKGVDVGRAFRTLNILCARNKVKADFQTQRFHERPGLKRKRLKSQRWRRAFKEGFKGMVSQVVAMRRQGW